jgi:transcriptional regulator with XRE-family HTH domain
MKVLGSKLKEERKRRRISQKELSRGICTQATISNIESKGICDSLLIITQICNRLNVPVDQYVVRENDLVQLLQVVEELYDEGKQIQAYATIQEYKGDITSAPPFVQAKYYYYKGITGMDGEDTDSNTLFNLFEANNMFLEPKIYTVLSAAAIGSYYVQKGDLYKAKVYYDKALEQSSDFKDTFSKEICQVYVEAAELYTKEGKYKKGIELCDKGIRLCVKKGKAYNLARLLYLKAKNRQAAGLYALDDYKSAYYFNRFVENEQLSEEIEKEMNKIEVRL